MSELCVKLAARQDGIPMETMVVTTGLNNILKVPDFKDTIMDAVQRCTRITIEASRLLNGFVLQKIENGQVIPPLDFESGLILQAVLGAKKMKR
jgi:hypothetical protein